MERLNRMVYNRIEPPYSSGTHLTCLGPERGTLAGGTLCMVPPAGVVCMVPPAGVERQHAVHHPGRPATEKYPHKWTKYSNSSIWDPFGSITSRNQHPTLPLTEELSLERLNGMAYNRIELPYSSGTHLTGRGPETGTPAGGTLCRVPRGRACAAAR